MKPFSASVYRHPFAGTSREITGAIVPTERAPWAAGRKKNSGLAPTWASPTPLATPQTRLGSTPPPRNRSTSTTRRAQRTTKSPELLSVFCHSSLGVSSLLCWCWLLSTFTSTIFQILSKSLCRSGRAKCIPRLTSSASSHLCKSQWRPLGRVVRTHRLRFQGSFSMKRSRITIQVLFIKCGHCERLW